MSYDEPESCIKKYETQKKTDENKNDYGRIFFLTYCTFLNEFDLLGDEAKKSKSNWENKKTANTDGLPRCDKYERIMVISRILPIKGLA